MSDIIAVGGGLILGGIACYALIRHFFSVVRAVARQEIDPEAPTKQPLERSERGLIRKLSAWAGLAMLGPVFLIYWGGNFFHGSLPIHFLVSAFLIFSLISLAGALRLIFARRKSVEEGLGCVLNLVLCAAYLFPVLSYEMIRSRDNVSWRSDPAELRSKVGRLFHFDPPAGMTVKHLYKHGFQDASFWLEAEVPDLAEFSQSLKSGENGEWISPDARLPRILPDECKEWWPGEAAILKMRIYQREFDKEIKFGSGYRLYFDEVNGRIYGVTYSM